MVSSRVVYNERSWGIDLISEVNMLVSDGRYAPIARAGGEQGVRGDAGQASLFPDVLLTADQPSVLMGWELKMPDTPVQDSETVVNAKEKARRLGTRAFLIWNVNEAVLHIRVDDDGDHSEPVWKIHPTSWVLEEKLTRAEVSANDGSWKQLLRRILDGLRELVAIGDIRKQDLAGVIGDTMYADLLAECTDPQAQILAQRARDRADFAAEMRQWAAEVTGKQASKVHIAQASRLLAQNHIISWVSKVVFAHQLKTVTSDAFAIDKLGADASAVEFATFFDRLSARNDFKALFSPTLGSDQVSGVLERRIGDVHGLLKELTASAGGGLDFSRALSSGLDQLRGKAAGQYATPEPLARLLVGVTMLDRRGAVIDPCSGSGTVARAAWDLKCATGDDSSATAASTWASDKFTVPVGLTGLALADPEAMGQVQQVFRNDVADLRPGIMVPLTDPVTGHPVERKLPRFSAVVSNLPFIRFEHLGGSQDQARLADFAGDDVALSGKSDLYAWIIFGLRRLIAENGRIGVIVSNSWLATTWGADFKDALTEHFDVEYLIFSSRGRWFDNADVVTTILVLTAAGYGSGRTSVAATRVPIAQWDNERVDMMVQALLVRESIDDIAVADLEPGWLRQATRAGISWTAGLGGDKLITDLLEVATPISAHLDIVRGVRPGTEKMFFFTDSERAKSGIEDQYFVPLLHGPAQALKERSLIGLPANRWFFRCLRSPTELRDAGHIGALEWIERWANSTNAKSKPFPEVLKGKPHWYSIDPPSAGEFVAQLAPYETFAFYRPATDILLSQRFISMALRDDADTDSELIHALLNSSLCILWQEITGFARGEGVLDRNMKNMRTHLRMPNPALIDSNHRSQILNAFAPLATRAPLPIAEEFSREDRRTFEKTVLAAVGLDGRFSEIEELIISLVSARISVTNKKISPSTTTLTVVQPGRELA